MDDRGQLLYTLPNRVGVIHFILVLIISFFLFIQGLRAVLYHSLVVNDPIWVIIGLMVIIFVIIKIPGAIITIFTSSTEIYENGIQHHNPLGKKENIFKNYIWVVRRYYHHFEDMNAIYLSDTNPNKKQRLIIANKYGLHTIAFGREAEERYKKLKPAFDRYKERGSDQAKTANYNYLNR